jgi:acyl-CoA thioester hydrolase
MVSPFSIPVRVYYEDTDSGGVVYYANYLKFMERARTEWLRALGFEQDALAARHGVLFAVRSVRIDFLKPGRFNDQLTVTVELARCGRASVTLHQRVQRGDLTLCDAEVKVACIAIADFAPCPLPAEMAARLATGVAA